MTVSATNDAIIVKGASIGSIITVYSSEGSMLAQIVADHNEMTIPLAEIDGVFIVKVDNVIIKIAK